jgi:hypothetical protein
MEAADAFQTNGFGVRVGRGRYPHRLLITDTLADLIASISARIATPHTTQNYRADDIE